MHEAEIHWFKAAFWSSFNHLICSQWFPLAYKQYPLSPRAGTSWQTPSRLTLRTVLNPCAVPSNMMPGTPGLPGVWGSPGLTLPSFLFYSTLDLWVHFDLKTARWWQSLQYDLPCWFGHGHITESIHGVSTPSWGTLWHHALGQTGPWPHHLTCLLLSCLSTLSTAWSGARGRQDWYGANLATTGMAPTHQALGWALPTLTSSF